MSFSALLWSLYGLVLAPALDASCSARQLMLTSKRDCRADAEVGLVAWREQMLLQAQRPATDFGFSAPVAEQWTDAREWLAHAPMRRWVLAPETALPVCLVNDAAMFVGRSNRGVWWLIPCNGAGAACPANVANHLQGRLP